MNNRRSSVKLREESDAGPWPPKRPPDIHLVRFKKKRGEKRFVAHQKGEKNKDPEANPGDIVFFDVMDRAKDFVVQFDFPPGLFEEGKVWLFKDKVGFQVKAAQTVCYTAVLRPKKHLIDPDEGRGAAEPREDHEDDHEVESPTAEEECKTRWKKRAVEDPPRIRIPPNP